MAKPAVAIMTRYRYFAAKHLLTCQSLYVCTSKQARVHQKSKRAPAASPPAGGSTLLRVNLASSALGLKHSGNRMLPLCVNAM